MEQISEWLEDEGLSAYIPSFSKAVARGDDLFKMTSQEMERELGISLPIHQKKLTYALKVSFNYGLKVPLREFPNLLEHRQLL